jgi:sirohydrochlorin cobaltochelatase
MRCFTSTDCTARILATAACLARTRFLGYLEKVPQNEAVVLIGHGGIAKGTPPDLVSELRRLAAERQRSGQMVVSHREAELDRQIRNWPRTPETDPYKIGVEALARALAPLLGNRRLVVAYNEFCAPSIDEAIDSLVEEQFERITLVTTMYTRGGTHAEFEIPELVAAARNRHPRTRIEYAWPFDTDLIADFLSRHLASRA